MSGTVKKSVSAIFCHQGEIFSIVRQERLRAFPGYTGFPGGQVEPGEGPLSALAREIDEELGVDLIEQNLSGNILDIHQAGLAVTPDFNPLQFSTRFFAIALKERVPFKPDRAEIATGQWDTPAALLARWESGQMLAVPPMVVLIKALADGKSGADLSYRYDPEREVPAVQAVHRLTVIPAKSNTLPPADRTNAFLFGDDKVCLIDPSPADEQEYGKLQTTLEKLPKANEIFLTHHHPDHHQHAPRLARQMGVPLGMSRDTHERIQKKWGADYLGGVTIAHYKEGDVLTRWLGKKVLVHQVPGHDEGQLALAPESLEWAIVGDLIQTVGTVVIGGEEGDMAKYFVSLEKMIRLNPKVIFPSHGLALGGVAKLKETLEHRRMRERQVQSLLEKNTSPEDMLPVIYPKLDSRLRSAALETIKAHIKKLPGR